jgi:hypothetical protein
MNDYIVREIRDKAVLTTAYVAGTVLEGCEKFNQMNLLVEFTKGDLTSLEVKVEFSPNGVGYFQETASAVSGGTSTDSLLEHTFTSSGNYRLPIPIKDGYVKVSAKGTGTVTSSFCRVRAILGNV